MKWNNFNLFKRMLYNCQKAQRLTIKRQESKLSPMEYLQYKIHLNYCSICRKFERFSALINQAMSSEQREIEENPANTLSSDEKRELQRKVDAFDDELPKR